MKAKTHITTLYPRSNSPHKTIEDICQLAADRVAAGEQQSAVYSDLVEGFGFEHQSANAKAIENSCIYAGSKLSAVKSFT
jgi:hypothetical protein